MIAEEEIAKILEQKGWEILYLTTKFGELEYDLIAKEPGTNLIHGIEITTIQQSRMSRGQINYLFDRLLVHRKNYNWLEIETPKILKWVHLIYISKGIKSDIEYIRNKFRLLKQKYKESQISLWFLVEEDEKVIKEVDTSFNEIKSTDELKFTSDIGNLLPNSIAKEIENVFKPDSCCFPKKLLEKAITKAWEKGGKEKEEQLDMEKAKQALIYDFTLGGLGAGGLLLVIQGIVDLCFKEKTPINFLGFADVPPHPLALMIFGTVFLFISFFVVLLKVKRNNPAKRE